MVRTCTASASLSSRRLRSSSLLSVVASSTRWRSHAVSAVAPICSVIAAAWSSSPTWRRSVIRRSPSTIASTRAGRPSSSVIASISDATPFSRSTRAQWCRRRWTSSHASSSASATSLGRPAEEERQRRGARAGRVGGALDRLEQPQPLERRLGAEHAAGAVDDGGDVDGLQRVADARGVAVRPHEHGDVAGADGTLVRRPAPERSSETMSAATSQATCWRAGSSRA